MRSFDPSDDYDVESLKKLNAEPWMIEQLSLNPSYVFWGPGEDYMKSWIKKDGEYHGWETGALIPNMKEFQWTLDELNECVNFYFQLDREAVDCEFCLDGYNAQTSRISEDFYDFERTGNRWCDRITMDELKNLIRVGRIDRKFLDVPDCLDVINRINSSTGRLSSDYEYNCGVLHHDAINRGFLIEARAKRLGVWGYCEKCQGTRSIYTAPKARLQLVLWIIHPRKGCSRGVLIEQVDQEDLPKAYAFLKEAAKRNHERFSKIP